MIGIDLPSLQSITLGNKALEGYYSSSLIMRSMNDTHLMIEYRSSKSNNHQFWRFSFPKTALSDIRE